ncbi:MAG: hypothetical protein ACKVQA_20120 [Burkholderiales bacterium]
MLNWLAKPPSKPAESLDSLDSEKGLKAFWARLPSTDCVRALEAVSEPFEKSASLNMRPDRLRHVLKQLDERAQEIAGAVWARLFEAKDPNTISDTAWLVLVRYYRNVHTGYRVCLDALPARESLSSADRADAILLASRAMSALGTHKALLRLRHRDPEPQYWVQLNNLAAWMAPFGKTQKLIELYTGSAYHSNADREYLIALIFDVAPVANMLPNQIAALDLILRQFSEHYYFSANFGAETPFTVDRVRAQAPQRWLKGLALRPGQIFFGLGAAYSQLTTLLKDARASGQVPSWLAVSRADTGQYCQLLELLLAHWSVDPPKRRLRRESRDGELLVAHGIDRVRRMIAAGEFAKAGKQLNYEDYKVLTRKIAGTIDFDTYEARVPVVAEGSKLLSPMEVLQRLEIDQQVAERWTIADISENGIGAVANAHGGWALAGMLVGYRRMDSLDWKVGVISRLTRSAKGKLSFGLETFAGKVRAARVSFGEPDPTDTWISTGSGSKGMHNAILLDSGGSTTLLLALDVFSIAGEYKVSYDQRWRKVRLDRILKRGYDYEEIEVSTPAGI